MDDIRFKAEYPTSYLLINFVDSWNDKYPSRRVFARIFTDYTDVIFEDHCHYKEFEINWIKRKMKIGREFEIFKIIGS